MTDKIRALLSQQPATASRPGQQGDDPTFGNLLSALVTNQVPNQDSGAERTTPASASVDREPVPHRSEQRPVPAQMPVTTSASALASQEDLRRDSPQLRMSESLRSDQTGQRSNEPSLRDNAESRSVHKHTLSRRLLAKRQAAAGQSPEARLENKPPRPKSASKTHAADPQGAPTNPLVTVQDVRVRDAGPKALPTANDDLLAAAAQGPSDMAWAASLRSMGQLGKSDPAMQDLSGATALAGLTGAEDSRAASATSAALAADRASAAASSAAQASPGASTNATSAATSLQASMPGASTEAALRFDTRLAAWQAASADPAVDTAANAADNAADNAATARTTAAANALTASSTVAPGAANTSNPGLAAVASASPSARAGTSASSAQARDTSSSTLAKFGRDSSRGAALGQWVDAVGSAISQALSRAVDGTTTVRSGMEASQQQAAPTSQTNAALTPIGFDATAGNFGSANSSPLNSLMQAAGLQAAGLMSGQPSGPGAVRASMTAPVPDIGLRTSIDAPFGSEGFQLSTARTLKLMADEGVQRAEIALNPLDLGPLEIRLDIQGQEATISFLADQPETRESLEKALPQLREMLSEQGLTLGETHVGQRQASDQGSGHGNGQQAARSWQNVQAQSDGASQEALLAGEPAARRAGRGLLDVYV